MFCFKKAQIHKILDYFWSVTQIKITHSILIFTRKKCSTSKYMNEAEIRCPNFISKRIIPEVVAKTTNLDKLAVQPAAKIKMIHYISDELLTCLYIIA